MYYTVSANKPGFGGCRQLVTYFDKEQSLSEQFSAYLDKESEIHGQGYFFNQENSKIEKDEVITGIDRNCKGLKVDESRFFSLTFNPSDKEIQHIEALAMAQLNEMGRHNISRLVIDNEQQIKDALVRDMLQQYSVRTMDQYAQNFGREGVESSKDIVWYGRVERDRYWKHTSKEVQHNKKIDTQIKRLKKEPISTVRNIEITNLKNQYIFESDLRRGGQQTPVREMMPKSGNNYHIHVIVSRKDCTQTKSLSPMANARSSANHVIQGRECKIGFDRDCFAQKVESTFDKSFGYTRFFQESYEGRKTMKLTPELYKAKEAEYNIKNNITGKDARQAEIDTMRGMTKTQSMAEDFGNSLAQKAGLAYINEEARPYTKTIKFVRKAGKLVITKSKAIKTAELARVAGKMAQATKVVTATNPATLIIDVGVSLVKGFARGI